MENHEMQKKIQKSKKYAHEADRFKLLAIKTEMTSRHGHRFVSFRGEENVWECTCDFYQEQGTCSHIMALQQIMSNVFHASDFSNKSQNLLENTSDKK